MDARLLELFLRVLELGSINRAAGELRLSQPSVSRRLIELEREVGTPVVIRTPQGIRPTDAGLLLAQRARPILRQLNLLKDEVSQKASAQVTLAVPFSLRQVLTVPFTVETAKTQPHVRLRLFEGMNNQIRAMMEEGLVDAAIVVSTERVPASFEARPLVSEPLFLVGSKATRLKIDTPVPLSRLSSIELILPARPNAIRAHLENAMRRGGFSYRGRIEAETLTLCVELTRRGLGYTTLPASALVGRRAGEFSAAPIKGMGVVWNLCLNRARSHSVVVRETAEAIRELTARQIARHVWRYAKRAAG